MGHAFILVMLLAYKAFMGNFMIGVVPSDVSSDLDINNLYKTHYTVSRNDTDKISKNIELVSPVIEAKSVIAIDLNNDQVLFAKDAYKKRQIASITKIMTALVVVEKMDLDEIVTVSEQAASVIGSQMELLKGENFSARALLQGMLINSANDAAYALADAAYGSQDEFVKEMNNKAKSLGLINTRFSNSVGLDSKNNYSTAFEVYLMIQEFLKHPILRKTVNTRELVVENTNGKEHRLKNTNKNLDSFLEITGIKTGTTDLAGESLVNLLKANDENEIVLILLDSPKRFSEAKILGDWCLRAYDYAIED